MRNWLWKWRMYIRFVPTFYRFAIVVFRRGLLGLGTDSMGDKVMHLATTADTDDEFLAGMQKIIEEGGQAVILVRKIRKNSELARYIDAEKTAGRLDFGNLKAVEKAVNHFEKRMVH